MAETSHPHVGVDFDNTIVAYDSLFKQIAMEEGLIPENFPAAKSQIRDYLRACGKEPAWSAMQGIAYGPRITEAAPFPGVSEFFSACRRAGLNLSIVSHKTKQPIEGEPFDLHDAARRWLKRWGFTDLVPAEQIYLELTRHDKLERVRKAGCTHFIDDLPEFLTEPLFPAGVERILFDPAGASSPQPGIQIATSWSEIQGIFTP